MLRRNSALTLSKSNGLKTMAKNNKPITKDRLKKELGEFTEEVLLPSMQRIFVTKDDSKKFATKDDLKNFATKDDLKNMKEEIKEETIGGVNKLLNKADEIINKLDEKKVEDIAGIEAYKRHDKKLEDHEERIATLETKAV